MDMQTEIEKTYEDLSWVQNFVELIDPLSWIWCEETWWQYVECLGVWQERTQEALNNIYYDWCELHKIDNKDAKEYRNDVMTRLKANLYRPLWKDLELAGFTHFQNGMFSHKDKTIVPFQAGFYSREQLAIEFKPGSTPTWDMVWAVYEEQVDLFEKCVQATLLKNHDDECMVFGVGPTGSGKGTISQVLGIAYGPKMTSYSKLNDLGYSSFGLYPLVGKRINLDREAQIGYLNSLAVSYLKDIVTHEGPMQINCKCRPQYDADLDIWFFTFTNQLYQLPSGTDRKAFFRRVVLLEIDKTQPKNPEFKQKIAEETPAIISNICLRDPERVFPQGFDVDEYVKHIAERWEFWSEPVKRVLSALFDYSPNPIDDLECMKVQDWVEEALKIEGINEKADVLKGKITMFLGLMKIHKRQKNRVAIYYNIKPKDPAIIQQLKDEKEIEEAERESHPKVKSMDDVLGGPSP